MPQPTKESPAPSKLSLPSQDKPKPRPPSLTEMLVTRLRVRDGDPETGRRSSTDTFALPRRMHPTDAGFDLESCQSMLVPAGQSARIPHNLAIHLPAGHYGVVMPRSSTLAQKGLIVIPGTIDADFRGELQTVVFNTTPRTVQILERERLSQLLVLPLINVSPIEVDELLPGEGRGESGWGSTGGFREKK